MMTRALSFALAIGLAAPAFAAGPLLVTSAVLIEQRTAAADGTTRTRLVAAGRATPGDRLVVSVSYRNTGRAPIGNLAITNPIPAGLLYRGPAAGQPAPEVSIDGVRFGSLATLSAAGRPATPADITHVRWRLARALGAGGGGVFAFSAVLK